MSSFIASAGRWLKHRLPFPASRRFWLEQLGVLILLVGAVGLLGPGQRLSVSVQAILWAGFGLAAAFVMRRGWIKLFGPVLFYDLLRVGRRSRYILFRTLYVIVLFVLLLSVYGGETKYSDRLSVAKTAKIAEKFFFTLMTVQLLMVLVLTPAYLAGCIAEEKDRKTLEFLLATDLDSREIVLGKLLARLANMALIVLAALPVLSATQFFGGVDPDLLLASFAGLGLTMLSLAAVSILMSVLCRRPRDAIVLTYLMAAAYPMLAFLAKAAVSTFPSIGALGIPLPEWEGIGWFTVSDLVGAFNAGNLFFVLWELDQTLDRGQSLGGVLPGFLGDYAIFHGSVALLCTTWAVARLRPVALREAFGKPKKGSFRFRWLGRPPVGSQPMLWKEIFAEPGLHFHWFGRVVMLLLIAASFLPPIIVIDAYLDHYLSGMGGSHFDVLAEAMNIWVRAVGTIVAMLLLLAVAARASGSISGERDKQTLDELLTTPLKSSAILWAKCLGAVLSVRWGWAWLGMIWLLGIITGGLQPFAVVVLLGAWLIYAGVFACVGLWYSTVSRTTLRSTLWTLLTVLFIGGGHWLVLAMCCFAPLELVGVRDRDMTYLAEFLAGQTPPAVFVFLALGGRDLQSSYRSQEMLELIGFSIFGLVCWTMGGLVLANILAKRFARLTNRQPFNLDPKGSAGPRSPADHV